MNSNDVISLDPVDHAALRDADSALTELRAVTVDAINLLEGFGKEYPDALILAAVVFGTPVAVAVTLSTDENDQRLTHCLPPSLSRMRTLAEAVAAFPDDLLNEFEMVLRHKAEIKAIREQYGTSAPEGEAS